MFRKNYFTILFSVFLLLTGSIAVFSQNAPVSGKVELKKADGTTEPVQGATVEVYRTDIKGKLPSAKTNKKGEFSFAGLPLGAVFTFSVSGPNIAPTYQPNIKAGIDRLVITVSEGNGRKLTEEEVRSALTSGPPTTTAANTTPELTAEQKKAMEDQAKLKAEVEEKNKKIENENTIIMASLKAGNEAYEVKNYDLAVSEYDKGIRANPTFVGSAPGLLNNKGLALSNRAIDLYNQAVKMTDAAAKAEAYSKVIKDFSDSIDSFNSSFTILKSTPATEIPNQQNFDGNKAQALNGARSVIKYMILTEKVDPQKISVIASLLNEYLAFETDAVKKAEAEIFIGDIYRINGDSQNAIVEYKKVLEKSPSNADALAGLGLSQANAGYNTDGSINDTMMQESINNLQKFTEVAPANHKLKESVKQTVDYLKTQNFKPQKSAVKKKS